jgi:hypothetical protein
VTTGAQRQFRGTRQIGPRDPRNIDAEIAALRVVERGLIISVADCGGCGSGVEDSDDSFITSGGGIPKFDCPDRR